MPKHAIAGAKGEPWEANWWRSCEIQRKIYPVDKFVSKSAYKK